MSTVRLLCRCLALRDDPDLRAVLADPRLDDMELFALANEAELGPALAVRLEARGLLHALPAEAADYLDALRGMNAVRNRALRAQALGLAARLEAIGVTPLVLKGGAFLFDRGFEDPAARLLADLDVLVPAERLLDCVALLRADHEVEDEGRIWSYQFLPMARVGDLAPIELHQDLGEQRHVATAAEAFAGAVRLTGPDEPGLFAASPTVRLMHAIFHAEIQDRALELRRLPLKTLIDVQQLRLRFGADIDWDLVRARLGRVAEAHLELAYLLLGQERPWTFGRAAARSAARRLVPRAAWIERLVDLWARVSFPYKRSKIDYLYGTQASTLRRQLWRVRHTGAVLARHARQLLARP